MYYRVHEALAEKIVVPDLIVYLRADTDVLMQRIALRDRPYERNMDGAYIEELNLAYEAFFADHQSRRSPVLVMDTNNLDYVRCSDDLEWVADRIRQTLKMPPYQTELPLAMS
jgi:deoxyguanosine kinase